MLAKIIAEFKERLFFGVHHDLVDLMKIPNLNSQRARALYDQGVQTLSDLANSDLFTIENILYNSICFDTKQRDGENEWDAEQRNKLRYLFVTGKSGTPSFCLPSTLKIETIFTQFFASSGLTVREAAEEMIADARRYLELEMGVENIVWSKSSKQSQSSQNSIVTEGITAPNNTKATSQQSSNLPHIRVDRKRKLDDDASNSSDYLVRTGSRLGKKFRPSQSESESESESDSDSELLNNRVTCARLNSTQNADDQNELIDKMIRYERFHLINVFEKLEFFKIFEATVKNSCPVVSVSVGVNQLLQRAPVIGLRQAGRDDEDIGSYKCNFDDDKYIAGISLCLGETEVVYYLNMQNETSDDAAITFDMKIKFLVDLFHNKRITVIMYDAKEQCKVLLKCVPQLRTFCVQLRDPLVADWLLQPDVYGNLLTMVSVTCGQLIHVSQTLNDLTYQHFKIRQYSPNCAGIGDIAGIHNRNRGSISLNCRSTTSPKIR